MKCPKHPRYAFKRKPSSTCEACWLIWLYEKHDLHIPKDCKLIQWRRRVLKPEETWVSSKDGGMPRRCRG